MIYFPIQFIYSLGLVRMVFNSSFNLNIQFFVTCFYDFISFKRQISLWFLFFRSPDSGVLKTHNILTQRRMWMSLRIKLCWPTTSDHSLVIRIFKIECWWEKVPWFQNVSTRFKGRETIFSLSACTVFYWLQGISCVNFSYFSYG